MAPPPPKKPRADLAKALAAASQWHFSTKNLSEKNRRAAEKNYEFVKRRIRETGGDLTPAEKTMAKSFRAERAKAPPPRPRLGDASDRTSAAQRKNLARGAAKTGGMGQAERKRIERAFTTPEDYPGRRGNAILKELKRQGFPEPKSEQQAQAQFKQLVKSFDASERSALKEARKHPLRVGWNAPLIGREAAEQMAITNARNMAIPRPSGPNLTWAGKIGDALDYITPDAAEKPASIAGGAISTAGWAAIPSGLRPALKPVVKDIKELTAGAAMAVPAIAETIYKDVTGPREKRGDLMARMAWEMAKGWGQGVERATPIPQHPIAYAKAVAKGDTGYAVRSGRRDIERMKEEWGEHPVTAALNVYPLASGAARLATFPSLVRSISRANPEMSKSMVLAAARKESYRPGYGAVQLARGKGQGWKGGIPTRTLRGQIKDPVTGEVLGEKFTALARPASRSALGRGIQATYDKWSRGDGVMGIPVPVPRKFSELSRAAKAYKRGRVLEWEARRVDLVQQAAVIEKYIGKSGLTSKAKNVIFTRLDENRSRMAELYYGPQGPSGIDAAETLTAVAEDLRQIAREGGQAIPEDKLIEIDKTLRRVDIRMEQLGPTVDLTTGGWAQATNLMREAGYPQGLIEDSLELAAHRARVWAKAKPGRDPNDWIDSPEGRDIMGFEYGVPPEAAMEQSLFQVLYPGDKDIPEHPSNPYRANRAAYDEQLAAHQAAKASGEIPQNQPFEFEPPERPAYTLTPESKKSKAHLAASRALDESVDVTTGEMLPGADPLVYESVAPHLPREAEQRPLVDGKGEVQIGRTTLDQKEASLKAFYRSLEPEGKDLFARWYERVWDYVAYLYGDDAMRQMGDAFFASQAAQSPAGGIANLFRVAEQIHRGEKMPTGKEQWLQRNIWKLMTGEHLGENPSGLAAKLMDFMDSGLGFRMRSIMQSQSKVGPGVVDRWTWRSDGYYPKPNESEGGDMISRRIEGEMDYDPLSTEKQKAVAYEYSSKRLQLLTNRLNRQGFGGRRDWTVDQVQALDWFATKKKWVEEGFTPKSAEGGSPLDMALDNTREVTFHGSPDELRQIAEETGAGVRIVSGLNRTGEGIEFSTSPEGVTHAIVAGAGGALDRLRLALGERGHTVMMRYPGSMGGTSSKRSHQIDFPVEQKGLAAEAIRDLMKEKDAPNLYRMGESTLRLDFGNGTRALARAQEVAEKMGIDPAKIEARLTEASGTPDDVLYDYRRMEKAITQGNRAIKERGKKGPSLIDMEQTLASLQERLGLRKGDKPTDEQILALADEVVKESRGQHEVLYQRHAQGIAGAVQWMDTDAGKQTLFLAEHANPSTFAHELFGHAAHEMKREYPTEFAAVEKRYKKPYEEWAEVEHERFATEFERYLMTGKAPVPELQPVFTRMRGWMKTVYSTIKELGKDRINPETEALFDRYFGKEPLDFAPPARVRRTGRSALPHHGDAEGVSRLVDETADLLNHGPDTLRADPKRRQRIGGSMEWLEQQILPYLDQFDPKLAAQVTDLFEQFDEVKSGSSIFNADERRLLAARGKLIGMRHAQLDKMHNSLRAQPDAELMDRASRIVDDLESAETLEDIQKSIGEFKPIVKEVGRRSQYDNESQKLLERQIADIERALDPDRKVDKDTRDEALAVLQEMSEQMDEMFLKTYGEGLSGEGLEMMRRTMAARASVLTTRLREKGLLDEGTGPGAYMPHYSIFDKLTNQMRGAVRLPAAGANRKRLTTQVRNDPRTFGRGPNKLIRYGSGELQIDPRTMISAYKNRLRFLETSQLRDDLYKMGVEIPKVGGNPRVPKGWYLINGSKQQLPARIRHITEMGQKELDDLLATGEDVDSLLKTDSGTQNLLEEWSKTWLSKGEIEKLDTEWKNDSVRMLPPEVVETMVGKVFESTPGGGWQAGFGILAVGGRVATIFSHPMGYITANAAANAMLLGLTRPSAMPRAITEFFRGPWSLRKNNFRLYQDITTQTGDFQAGAGIPDFYVKGQGKMEWTERAATTGAAEWAGALGKMGDQPFRVASWTGHARKYGFKDAEAWRELLDSTDPELVGIRNTIGQRSREDMLDFNKLSDREKTMARYFFIWPFIRAATAQPFWMLREYPGRLAAMAQAAQGQQAAYAAEGIEDQSVLSKYNAVAPAGERTMYDLSEVPVGGRSINLNPVNPLGPLAEKVNDLGTVVNDPKQIGRVAAGYYNPAFTALAQGSFGYGGMDWEKIIGSTVPLASYVQAAMSAKKRGAQKYTDRDSFWDYVRRRELRFGTEHVSAETIRESGKKEAEKADTRPAWEKQKEEDLETAEKIFATGKKKTGRDVDTKTKANVVRSINAYNAIEQAEDKLKEELGVNDLTELQRIEATEAVLLEFYPRDGPRYIVPRAAIERLPEKARGGKESQNGYRRHLRDVIQYWRSLARTEGRNMGLEID